MDQSIKSKYEQEFKNKIEIYKKNLKDWEQNY